MEIDGGAETVSGLSPGSFTSLNVDIGVLFVGGTPLFLPPTNLIRFRNTGEEVTHSLYQLSLSLSLSHTHTHTHTHSVSCLSLSYTQ